MQAVRGMNQKESSLLALLLMLIGCNHVKGQPQYLTTSTLLERSWTLAPIFHLLIGSP